jgi:hypothetical protein
MLALLAPWQIQEGPPRALPPRPLGAALPAAALERLLVGVGPRGAEARLRIGHGPLAGAEIHLRHLPGGIEAVVLTRVECSRQTLAVAMEEVARRLQRKGYAFRVTASRSGGHGDGPEPPLARGAGGPSVDDGSGGGGLAVEGCDGLRAGAAEGLGLEAGEGADRRGGGAGSARGGG